MPRRGSQLSLEQMGTKLAAVFDEGDLHDAKETIRSCLLATRTVRAGRDEGGHLIYREVPDYPIQLAAGVKIIEWAIGKPVSRSVIAEVHANANQGENQMVDGLMDLLLESPETAAEIVLKLKQAAMKAKKAAPVEVTATPSLPEGENGASESSSEAPQR